MIPCSRPIVCPCSQEAHEATHCVTVRGGALRAPAFYYVCGACLPEFIGHPSPGQSRTVRTLEDDSSDLCTEGHLRDEIEEAASGNPDLLALAKWARTGVSEVAGCDSGKLYSEVLASVQRLAGRIL